MQKYDFFDIKKCNMLLHNEYHIALKVITKIKILKKKIFKYV